MDHITAILWMFSHSIFIEWIQFSIRKRNLIWVTVRTLLYFLLIHSNRDAPSQQYIDNNENCISLMRKMTGVNIFRNIVIICLIFVRKGCSLTENQICVIFNIYRTIKWLSDSRLLFQSKKMYNFFDFYPFNWMVFLLPVAQTYENCLIDMSHNGCKFEFSTLFLRSFSFSINIKSDPWPFSPVNRFICFYWK